MFLKTESMKIRINNCSMPIVRVDSDLNILEASTGVTPLFEIDGLDAYQNLKQLFGNTLDKLSKATAKRKSHKEIQTLISKSGKTRWINILLYPLIEEKDAFHIFFEDVTTKQEQLELALQAKQIAKIGSWSVDLINNTVTWSDMTKEIHEVPSSFNPDLEQGISFYKKGIHRERIVEAVSECIEKGQPFDLELIIVTAKGREKWVRAIGEAEISNGKTIGFKGVFQDVDEIKRERLRNQVLDDRMRAAIESANIGIWDWDIEKDHLIWDQNMFVIHGVNAEDFDGAYDAWEATVHPEDKEQAALEVELALEGKKDFDTEFRITKGDGSIAYIQGRGQVFKNANGKPVRMVGINSDITRLKRKDDRLRHLLGVTEKQNQKLVNFAHIVSHNLRSNSTNISMISGMLLSNKGVSKTKEFLEMIQKSSEKLEETLNQLNEIVKIQSTPESDIESVAVLPILKDVFEGINAIVEDSKAKININFDDTLRVYGFKPYLNSIFQNLLTNSIKYRNPQKRLEITVEAETLKNQTILSFKDNGLGIDLKKHGKNLFGMYKTFHGNKDAKGIGLFMTKNQVEAMNGRIEVRSEVGQGATFMLYFKNK